MLWGRDILGPLSRWLGSLTDFEGEFWSRVGATFLAFLVYWGLRWAVSRVVERSSADERLRFLTRKTLHYLLALLLLLVVSRIWFEGMQDVATLLGLLFAGLALALRDWIASFVGWLYILWRHPFSLGDRIQVGAHAGDVIDIRMFQFAILEIGNWVHADQSTGRVVHIPNARVLTEPVANYSRGLRHIWNEIPFRLTFDSNWRRAKGMLQEIAKRHCASEEVARRKLAEARHEWLIYYPHLHPTVYTSIDDSGILLTVRYLTDPRQRRSSAEALTEDVLDAFAGQDDLRFAFPTRRTFNADVEGHPGPVRHADPSDGSPAGHDS